MAFIFGASWFCFEELEVYFPGDVKTVWGEGSSPRRLRLPPFCALIIVKLVTCACRCVYA